VVARRNVKYPIDFPHAPIQRIPVVQFTSYSFESGSLQSSQITFCPDKCPDVMPSLH
jgi:hypothetical protein